MCPIISEQAVSRLRYVVRIIYFIYFTLILVATLTLPILLKSSLFPIYSSDTTLTFFIEIGITGFSILCLIVGFLFPRLAGWHKKTQVSIVQVLYGHIIMAGFFFSIAMFGLFMNILGGSEFLALALFVLSAAALAVTFPTHKRLAKWRGDAHV